MIQQDGGPLRAARAGYKYCVLGGNRSVRRSDKRLNWIVLQTRHLEAEDDRKLSQNNISGRTDCKESVGQKEGNRRSSNVGQKH